MITLTNIETQEIIQLDPTAGAIDLQGAADIDLSDIAGDVAEVVQSGDDLIVQLANGEQVIINNFYGFEAVGQVAGASVTGAAAAGGISTMALVGGGVAVAGGAGLALAGGGDEGGSSAAPVASEETLQLAAALSDPASTEAPTAEDYAAAGVTVAEEDVAATNKVLAAALGGGMEVTDALVESVTEVAAKYSDSTVAEEDREVVVEDGTIRLREDTDGDGSIDSYAAVILDENGNVESELAVVVDTETGDATLTEEQLEEVTNGGVQDTKVDAINDVMGALIAAEADVDANFIDNVVEAASDHVGNASYEDVEVQLDGNTLTLESDVTGDGTADIVSTVELDDNGFIISENKVVNGEDQGTTTYQRDAEGRVTSQTTTAADGSETSIDRSFDEQGNLTQQTNTAADGTATVNTFERDAEGRETKKETKVGDVTTQVVETTFDEDGGSTAVIARFNEDGSEGLVTTLVRDEQGRTLSTDTPDGGAGNRTRINEYFEPNEDGTYQATQLAYNPDGTVWRNYRNSYDAEGRVTMVENDSGGTGHYNDIQTYKYDEYGRRVEYVRYNNNPDPDIGMYAARESYYIYDDFGTLRIQHTPWRNQDGSMNEYRAWNWDEDGRTVAHDYYNSSRANRSGHNYRHTQEFDEHGNLIKKRNDGADRDGEVNTLEIFQYAESNGEFYLTGKTTYNVATGALAETQSYVTVNGEALLESLDTFYANGQVSRDWDATYHENGQRASSTDDRYYEGGTQYFSQELTYYDNGQKATELKSETLEGKELRRHYEYAWDENGNLTLDAYRDIRVSSGGYNWYREYTYDLETNVLLRAVFTGDGGADTIIDSIRTIDYYADGQESSNEVKRFTDELLSSIELSTYNEAGQQLMYKHQTYVQDLEGNDVVDTTVEYWEKTYNADGNLLTYSEDTNKDGVFDVADTYETNTYDEQGNHLTKTVTVNGEVTLNESYTYTYDVDGNMLSKTAFEEGVETWVETYNAEGVVLTKREGDVDGVEGLDLVEQRIFGETTGLLTSYGQDLDGDGVIETVESYGYDADGNLTSKTITVSDTPTMVETYNADGVVLTRQEGDVDGVEGLDLVEQRIFDETTGLLTSYSQDLDGDGVRENVESYGYDVDGNLTSKTITVSDTPTMIETYNADGVVLTRQESDGAGGLTLVIERVFDSETGLLTSFGEDTDADGVIDKVETYNADGVVLTRNEGDVDGVEGLDLVERRIFDETTGLLTSYGQDLDGDGVIETVESYEYDADGNLTSKTITVSETPTMIETYNAEGVVLTRNEGDVDGVEGLDLVEQRSFDSETGLLTSYGQDLDGDGVIETIESYEYDADGNMTKKTVTVDSVEQLVETYDADGNLLTKSEDTDLDGNFNLVENYQTNFFTGYFDNNVISFTKDNDNDGVMDQNVVYQRDIYGYRELTKEGSGDVGAAFETVSFADGMDETFTLDATEAASMVGLSEIIFAGEYADGTITLSDEALTALAGDNPAYQLKISGGDAGDTLDLGAGFTATGTTTEIDGETYVEYTGTTAGISFIVDQDVDVTGVTTPV